jgi:hypothetical protein
VMGYVKMKGKWEVWYGSASNTGNL